MSDEAMTSKLEEYLREWSEDPGVRRIEDEGHQIIVEFDLDVRPVTIPDERLRELLGRFGYAVEEIDGMNAIVTLGSVRENPTEPGYSVRFYDRGGR